MEPIPFVITEPPMGIISFPGILVIRKGKKNAIIAIRPQLMNPSIERNFAHFAVSDKSPREIVVTVRSLERRSAFCILYNGVKPYVLFPASYFQMAKKMLHLSQMQHSLLFVHAFN